MLARAYKHAQACPPHQQYTEVWLTWYDCKEQHRKRKLNVKETLFSGSPRSMQREEGEDGSWRTRAQFREGNRVAVQFTSRGYTPLELHAPKTITVSDTPSIFLLFGTSVTTSTKPKVKICRPSSLPSSAEVRKFHPTWNLSIPGFELVEPAAELLGLCLSNRLVSNSLSS